MNVILLNKFIANLKLNAVENFVIPLPLDSLSASEFIGQKRIEADLIHLDAGHQFHSIFQDLTAWWELLKPGGWMVVDDYTTYWPGTVKAVDSFLARISFENFHTDGVKCAFRKPVYEIRLTSKFSLDEVMDSQKESETKRLRDSLAHTKARLSNVHSSLSWKLTSPARSARRHLRKFFEYLHN
jgi:hypothetical protein